MKALPRFLFRLAAGAAAFLLVVFALLVLWLRHVALPNIDAYREPIFASIEKASGMAVSARALHGGWQGLRPHVSLEGFRLADRRGKVALALDSAEVTLSWWALLGGKLRFHDVDFHRPSLTLRRGPDGLIYLADKPLNEAGPGDGAFTEWLLAQPRLGIHEATLTWRDEKAGAPEVQLTGVEIAVERRHGRHHAALSAVPPRELAGRIEMRADVRLKREDTHWRADGQAFVEARSADLAKLRAHLPVPETLRTGVGALRVWLEFTPEGLKEVVADLNMRDARAQLAADTLPLELATISGRAAYTANADGFTLATQGLRFRLASGVEAQQPGNFSFTRTHAAGQAARSNVRADGIDLKIAAALLDYFPVPRDVKANVLRFAPRGRIADATLSWSGEPGARALQYAVKGRFEGLGVNAVDALPGVSGLTGRIDGTQAGGTVVLDSKAVVFQLDNIFRAPLQIDALAATANWKRTGEALEISIPEMRVANADAEGTLAGTWQPGKEGGPGVVDIRGTLTRAVASRVAAYLPNRIAATRDWLENAVQAGSSNRINFELSGDLWHFPFGDGSGKFLIEGDIHGGKLKYHPEWPSIDAVEGRLRFENRRMEIHADQAAIFRSRAARVSAVIADLAAKPPVILIDGEIDTAGADAVRFLRESPLVNGPGAFTRAVSIEGPGRLKLALAYPLWGTDPVRVNGEYEFAGATASVGKSLTMQEVRGRLAFTERGVSAPQITGTIFGKPATLVMSTQADATVLTQIDGRIDAPALANYVPEAVAARLSGMCEWKARVVSGRQGTELAITSDLRGLASTLPEPLAKAAGEARPLTLAMARLGSDTEVTTATLGDTIHGRFARAAPGSEQWSAALKFGAPVSGEPVRDGLWLYGALPAIDVDAWQAVFGGTRSQSSSALGEGRREGATNAAAVELRGVDLHLARAHYWGRDFTDVNAQLERDASGWKGTIGSPLVAGYIDWNPAGKGRLIAKLERLAVSESTPSAQQGQQPAKSDADLPALDVVAEKFDFRGKWLGKLDLKAEPAGDEWRIDKLDIANGHAKFNSSGVWRRTGAGAITTLTLALDTENLNALMSQFGYGDYLKRGSGRLEGNLVWPGYPYDFALVNLAGSFKVEARRGQFAKMEPGVGKLLGLLSLQSLPRRAMFDFRDVFSEGFAFERIEGSVKVARGILLTDAFEISGPSAFVTLAGEVSLPQETQTLTMHIVPEVGEGIALAATLVGTPVLGLSTLLVSKLLRNPLGKVVAYEYQVTGSWDNPQVTRLNAPPAPATPQPAAVRAQAQTPVAQ